MSPEAGLFDFLLRGKGELSFSRLTQSLGKGERDLADVPGLSFRKNGKFIHNPIGPLADLKTIQRPNRQARVYDDFIFFGLPFDCLEISRGCVMNCRFCSITEMYGRSFRKFPLEKVLAEIDDRRSVGKKGIFFVDDNITLDVRWLRALSEAIIAEGLNHMHYIMQASVNGLHADLSLAKLLAKAGFRLVFLGMESGDQRTLDTLQKGYSVSKTKSVVSGLHSHGIVATGGFIVGNPDDRPEDIRGVFRFAEEIGLDHVILQCLTPLHHTTRSDSIFSPDSRITPPVPTWRIPDASRSLLANARPIPRAHSPPGPRPLPEDSYSQLPAAEEDTPNSGQPTGTVEPPRQAYGLPLIAPVCSISGRPAWFSCLFDLTLSPAPHPGAVLPSNSPGSHNILHFVFLTPNYATSYSLFVRKQFPIFGIGKRTVVESKIPGLTKMVVPAYYFAADLLPNQNETRGNRMGILEDERFEVKTVFIMEAEQGQKLK